ncbi:VOC family protein [Skermania piniformis]|uniref:Glyoxalase n=1 Tax=Skermania pinensis TaxID=39122 RepID=A0ABX8S8W0_9ACTN|nr:VOC family protein [Skermania piniformis]QXQ12995.1 glyoxalase [Skermania piniformis]
MSPDTTQHPPTVWPAFQAHDPRAVVDFLVALGFEETACYSDDAGVIQHAQLDWPEGGGVMLGTHKPEGPFTQQPGTTAAYIVTADIEAAAERVRNLGHDATIVEQDYGSREVTVRDAEGNQWTFGTYAGEPRAGKS